MTKRELMAMLAEANDDEVITFVVNAHDRDGYPFDRTVDVYKVIAGETKTVREEYGIARIHKA